MYSLYQVFVLDTAFLTKSQEKQCKFLEKLFSQMLLVNGLPQGPYLKGFRHRNAIRLTIQEQRAEKGNSKLVQRQLSRGILTKRFSENMQQICRRTPMPKCYFSKFAKYGCSHVNLLNICRTLFP